MRTKLAVLAVAALLALGTGSVFDERAGVHFEVWASELDEDVIHVDVAPIGEPDQTRVATAVDQSKQQVTAVNEPVKLTASDAVTIDGSDYDIVETEGTEDTGDEENATRLTADQAIQGQINESSIERSDDGTLTGEVDSTKLDDGSNGSDDEADGGICLVGADSTCNGDVVNGFDGATIVGSH